MRASILSAVFAGLLSAGLTVAQAANGTIDKGPFPEDLNGSNFTYQWPVQVFKFSSQLQDLEMAFMDIPAENCAKGEEVGTAVLLHGKNFCGPTWVDTIKALTKIGYRVIAPDQIGFCKSSKPADYQYSLSQLSFNTRGLLDTLGIKSATIIGHSMGGMMSIRFSLQYPEFVDRLVIVNAIGLEDYVAKGVPYIDISQSVAQEASQNFSSIKAYEQHFYYVDKWDESYNVWVTMNNNIYHGSERESYVRAQGRIVDMVLTQPVAPHIQDLTPKTLLMIGEKDTTAIGAQWAPPEVAKKLGHFDELAPEVLSKLKDGELISFPDLGHAPQISEPKQFNQKLTDWLKKQTS